MAKPRKPRLKVFQAQFGFSESVVAAPSQAAALRAWDTHQDLFASKDAQISTDEAAIAAAIEHPGTPLQRAVGTKDPFRPRPATPPGSPKRSAKTQAAKPKADRSQLDWAEAALHQLEQKREQEEAAMLQAEANLQARRTASRKVYAASRKAAAAAVAKARATYRAAGGRD